MTVSLSKITALEAALEYLIKATAGEKLEYLSPGEKAPGDTKIHTTPRGAKGYYPSEVARGEEDAEVPPELAPGEEQEVEVVQALEAKPKLSSEYPKRVFDPDTEQYLRVVVPDNPDVHGVEPGIHRLSQPHGPPVRGTPISIYDPRIPDNVYHMTTNAPAVRASRKLIAGGVGGLGGDDRDQIVSLTINKEIAYQLAEDTKLASEVGRMGGGEYKSPERIKASKAIIKRLIQEMEKEGWDTPTRFREYADDHFEYMHESYNAKEWLAQYFTVRASATAKLGKEKLNPLFFTEPETLAKINPENVDVIEIPKSALRTGAMITDLDLDNPYGLQEIRIYGDVGVPEAKTSPDNLSKLLVLDATLDYLVKAIPEKREYLAPGEKAPKGFKEYPGSRPGVRYYVPGSAGVAEAEAQGVAVGRTELEPDEAREITGVTAPDSSDVSETAEMYLSLVERGSMSSVSEVNDYFNSVSFSLNGYLGEVIPGFTSYLGKSIDLSFLTTDGITAAGFTDGSKGGTGRPAPGVGIHNLQNFTVMINDGSQKKLFIYKMVKGENQGELLAYTFDRILGLNVVPYMKPYSADIKRLDRIIKKSHSLDKDEVTIESQSVMQRQGTGVMAGGHFQEFCDNCLDQEASVPVMGKMLLTVEGRKEFFKVILLDYFTGNTDRHINNYLITSDQKIVAIDNGFAGRKVRPIDMAKTLRKVLDGDDDIPKISDADKDEIIKDISTSEKLISEAEDVFDTYFTKDTKKLLDEALSISRWSMNVGEDVTAIKRNFTEYAAWNIQMGILGIATTTVDTPLEVSTSMQQLLNELEQKNLLIKLPNVSFDDLRDDDFNDDQTSQVIRQTSDNDAALQRVLADIGDEGTSDDYNEFVVYEDDDFNDDFNDDEDDF